MRWSALVLLALLPCLLAVSGCKTVTRLADELGVQVTLRGQVDLRGDVPADEVTLEARLYRILENADSFDFRGCEAEGRDRRTCYGRFDLDALGADDAVSGLSVQWDASGSSLSIPGVPADVGYVLLVNARASGAQCGSDIVGIEEDTKLVTRDSVISPLSRLTDAQRRVAGLPRPLELRCDRGAPPAVEDVEPPPTPRPRPQPDPPTSGAPGSDPPGTGDPTAAPPTEEPLPPELESPETVSWERFRLLDRDGQLLADASGGPVVGGPDVPPCGSSRPMTIEATLEGGGGGVDRAWLHVQEGRGENAVIRDLPIPVTGGRIDGHVVQLSGGYARLQLDLEPIEDSSGDGASHVIEICSRDTPPAFPAQELLAVLSWDTDGTDVDLHTWVSGPGISEEHIYFANRNGRYAALDVDDVDGFGPETITSMADARNLTYDVKVHYWSDRGRRTPPTAATVRVVYANPDAGIRCDTTRVFRDIQNREWYVVGQFGPELAQLAQSDPDAFRALGCSTVR